MATEVRALLEEGAARLARVADDPRREAELLLGTALGRPRAWLLAHGEQRVLDCEATDRYEAFVTRRAHGEPVAYLLGEKEFWSLPLAVGPGVLIPRPETEAISASSRPTDPWRLTTVARTRNPAAQAIASSARGTEIRLVRLRTGRMVAPARAARRGRCPGGAAATPWSTEPCRRSERGWFGPPPGRVVGR